MNCKIAMIMGVILGSVVTAGIYSYRADTSQSSIKADDVPMVGDPSGLAQADDHSAMPAKHVSALEQTQGRQSAHVDGLINHINSAKGLMNISRDAIEKWHRGPATLDFVAAQSVDINKYRAGDMISFTFQITGAGFVITKATLLSAGNLPVGRHIRKSISAQAADTDS